MYASSLNIGETFPLAVITLVLHVMKVKVYEYHTPTLSCIPISVSISPCTWNVCTDKSAVSENLSTESFVGMLCNVS